MNKYFKFIILFILIPCYFYAQDNTPDRVEFKKNGWDYYKEGNYSASIKALLEEKRQFPTRINIYVILGWDYKKLGHYKLMKEVSLEGLKVSPTDYRVVLNLAESCYYQNQYNDAIKYFERYFSNIYNVVDYNLAENYLFLGDSYYNINQYYNADIALSTADYYRKNDFRVKLLLALTNEKLKKYDLAKSYFNEVLKLKPNQDQALDGLKRLEDLQQ